MTFKSTNCFGFVATTDLQAISVVEEAWLNVIVLTSYKGSDNQRLYQMHGRGGESVTKHLMCFRQTGTFISVPPHLRTTTCPAVAVNACEKMVSTFNGDTLLTSTDETLTMS